MTILVIYASIIRPFGGEMLFMDIRKKRLMAGVLALIVGVTSSACQKKGELDETDDSLYPLSPAYEINSDGYWYEENNGNRYYYLLDRAGFKDGYTGYGSYSFAQILNVEEITTVYDSDTLKIYNITDGFKEMPIEYTHYGYNPEEFTTNFNYALKIEELKSTEGINYVYVFVQGLLLKDLGSDFGDFNLHVGETLDGYYLFDASGMLLAKKMVAGDQNIPSTLVGNFDMALSDLTSVLQHDDVISYSDLLRKEEEINKSLVRKK